MAEVFGKGNDDVHCAVCMDELTNARYLRCFHSFCTRCLEHCIRNMKVSCPLCREVTCISKGIDSLLPNLGAMRRVKEAKVREKIESKIQDGGCQCESCRELGAVCLANSYCADCELLICDSCVNAHKLLKVTRKHRIIGVLEFQNNTSLIEKEKWNGGDFLDSRCEKHTAPLTIFCRTCERSLCPQCASVDHEGEHNDHEYVNINDIGEEMIEEIRQLLSKIDSCHFDRVMQSYKLRVKEISDKAQELRAKINESAQNEVKCLYAKVETKRIELNTQILDVEKSYCRKVTTLLSGLRSIRTRAEKLDGYAEELLKTGNSHDVIAVKQTLTDQLKNIRAEMRKLTANDTTVHDLDGYSFTATDWVASSYIPGVGRLESFSPQEGQEESPTGRFKRRLSGRASRTLQRPNTALSSLSSTRSLAH